MTIHFTQSCPTCGRRIEVRASLLGRTVGCRHCKAEFLAAPDSDNYSRADEGQLLMSRVEAAIRRSEIESVPVVEPIVDPVTAPTQVAS